MKRITLGIGRHEYECDESSLHTAEDGLVIEAGFPGEAEYIRAGTPAFVRIAPRGGTPVASVTGAIVGQVRLWGRSQVSIAVTEEDEAKVEKAMNERVSLRVEPDPADPVVALLDSGDEARVVDISTDGCLLEFPGHDSLNLVGWGIRLELLIPGDKGLLSLRGEIRKHARVGDALHVAVQFGLPDEASGATARRRLEAYVLQRRIDLLRERAARRSA